MGPKTRLMAMKEYRVEGNDDTIDETSTWRRIDEQTLLRPKVQRQLCVLSIGCSMPWAVKQRGVGRDQYRSE